MGELTLDSYFAEHPLDAGELRRGRALRLAACLRSDEGDFAAGPVSHLWVVLSCARAPRRPHAPRCVALPEGRGPAGARPVRLAPLARHELTLAGGERWVVEERAALVPDEVDRFLVVAGLLRVAAGRRAHRDLLGAYDARIANASVAADYPAWLAARREVLLARPAPTEGPLMSIVTPAFRTPPRLLREMLQSVLAQTYRRWELVLVNASPGDAGMRAVLDELADPRVRVVEAPGNLGIVGNTNLGIRACRGDYVSFLDHDDLLEPCALAELVRAIREGEKDGRAPGLLFCDEDNVDGAGRPCLPLIKPPLNADLLLSNDYVLHWLTVRRELLGSVALAGPEVEGAQDYDLTFKICELGTPVVRVPQVLYHWRITDGSSAGDPASKEYAQEAGVRAIEGHLARTGVSAEVRRGWAYFTYETRFPVPAPAPSVGLARGAEASPATAAALKAYAQARGTRAPGVGEADLVLFVTREHDLDLASLELLVGHVCRRGTFCAAPRVVRADGLLDYAGMILRPDGTPLRMLRNLPQDDGGYVGRAQRPYDALVVNPECFLADGRELARLGLDGTAAPLASGDALEAFVRAHAAGLCNVYLPYATARLNAPRSLMGRDPSPEELARGERLLALLPELAEGDPSHSPSFDPWSPYYRLRRG